MPIPSFTVRVERSRDTMKAYATSGPLVSARRERAGVVRGPRTLFTRIGGNARPSSPRLSASSAPLRAKMDSRRGAEGAEFIQNDEIWSCFDYDRGERVLLGARPLFSVRVERSRDTHRSGTPYGPLVSARGERYLQDARALFSVRIERSRDTRKSNARVKPK
jgi:hypothetical protein